MVSSEDHECNKPEGTVQGGPGPGSPSALALLHQLDACSRESVLLGSGYLHSTDADTLGDHPTALASLQLQPHVH